MLCAQSGVPFGFPQFFQVTCGAILDIRTRYRLDGLGIEPRWGRDFPHQTGLEAHPVSCTGGTGSFQGVKRPGRRADYPPPSSAEDANGL